MGTRYTTYDEGLKKLKLDTLHERRPEMGQKCGTDDKTSKH